MPFTLFVQINYGWWQEIVSQEAIQQNLKHNYF